MDLECPANNEKSQKKSKKGVNDFFTPWDEIQAENPFHYGSKYIEGENFNVMPIITQMHGGNSILNNGNI